MAIGAKIPHKLASNSRKGARIAIYEGLNRLYHAQPESVNGGQAIRVGSTEILDIRQHSCTLRTRINALSKPSDITSPFPNPNV
jgi:hypothetical protein